MDEHRKDERKRLMAFTPVYDSQRKTVLGYLGDLSMQGAMLIGEQPMEVNTQITLEIDFPSTPEFPARHVRIPARVAWCKQEENTQYFNTGFEFLKIDQMYKAFIEAILERYQFRRETLT
jgi:hypothetical protein